MFNSDFIPMYNANKNVVKSTKLVKFKEISHLENLDVDGMVIFK
jgi:hypothetical protein